MNRTVRGPGRPTEAIWAFRRAPLVRRVLRVVTAVLAATLAFVAVMTLLFIAAFGHPDVWVTVGLFFAVVPAVLLVLAVLVGLRAAVAAGPGWVGVRMVRRWRTVDLGDVRRVRVAARTALPGVAYQRAGGFPGAAGLAAPSLVFEDEAGHTIDIGVDALGSGVGDVVRHGLGPDAVIDVDAQELLDGPASTGDGDRP